jgi:hypothetical protein
MRDIDADSLRPAHRVHVVRTCPDIGVTRARDPATRQDEDQGAGARGSAVPRVRFASGPRDRTAYARPSAGKNSRSFFGTVRCSDPRQDAFSESAMPFLPVSFSGPAIAVGHNRVTSGLVIAPFAGHA